MQEKMDDWRLLRQYLDDGSQAAFAQLVNRHMKIVYWTCRRDTQSDQMAEDATQAVFVILAQKASSLKPGMSVAGWLFATARHVCRRTVRGEERRRHYEQEAAKAMQHSASPEAGWGQIEPWINDGLCRLTASDRETILLRYFDGLSLAEVAQATGTSELAARKRVSRAVERLRHYFAQKEVTVASAALFALLAEHSAKAAPVDYQAIARQAVQTAPASTAPIHPLNNPLLAKGLLLVSTTKIVAGGAAAVVLVLALTFVAVRHAHSTAQPGLSLSTSPTSSPTTQQAVDWQAPPASDSATAQAEQQIEANLGQFVAAGNSGDAQKMVALSPPPSKMTSDQLVQIVSKQLAQTPIHDCQFTVTSCAIRDNKAIVYGRMKLVAGTHTFNGAGRATLENVGGKWLIRSLGPAR